MKPSGLTPAVAGACCVSLLTVAALLSVPARVAAQAPVVAQAPAQAPSPTPTQAVQPAPVQAAQPAPTTKGTLTPADLGGVDTPPDYVIGPDDLLSIVFWREKEMSAEVAVRPDGMISLPLVNDVKAAGLTPEQLRAKVSEAASRFVEEPTVTVVVKAINSRKVFITGSVGKIGAYQLGGSTTVLQLIATAGGLLEYADAKKIMIVRTENGRQVTLRFNYKDVVTGKNLRQNIDLKPGDTVIVP